MTYIVGASFRKKLLSVGALVCIGLSGTAVIPTAYALDGEEETVIRATPAAFNQAIKDHAEGTFRAQIGSYEWRLPFVSCEEKGKKVTYVLSHDLADNIDLIDAATTELTARLVGAPYFGDVDVVVTPGDEANALAAVLVMKLRQHKPDMKLAVLRNTGKCGSEMHTTFQPCTHSSPKEMHVKADNMANICGRGALIFDDVIATGATANATRDLVHRMGGRVIAYACVGEEPMNERGFEGVHETYDGKPLVALTGLPVTEEVL